MITEESLKAISLFHSSNYHSLIHHYLTLQDPSVFSFLRARSSTLKSEFAIPLAASSDSSTTTLSSVACWDFSISVALKDPRQLRHFTCLLTKKTLIYSCCVSHMLHIVQKVLTFDVGVLLLPLPFRDGLELGCRGCCFCGLGCCFCWFGRCLGCFGG